MPALESPYAAMFPQKPVHLFIQRAQSERARLNSRFSENYTKGDRKQLRRERDLWFKDRLVKAACLYQAGMRHVTVDDWKRAADQFNPFEPIDHVVDWYRRPKSSHGYRIVCDLSWYMKAAHYMVAGAVMAQFNAPDFIYNLKRQRGARQPVGREALISALLDRLHAGFNHYRIYDVKDCFQHVGPFALSSLPLPWRVHENTLNLDNIQFRHDTVRELKHFADIASYSRATIHPLDGLLDALHPLQPRSE